MHRAQRQEYRRGSVRLEGKTWRYRIRVEELDPLTGKPTRRERNVRLGSSSELRSHAAARRAADLVLERLAPREILPGTRVQASTYFERYLRRVAFSKPSTRAAFGTIVRKHLEPHFAGRSLEQIDVIAAQDLVTELAAAQLARSTIRGIVALLKRILEAAILEGFAATAFSLRSLHFPAVVEVEVAPRCFSIEESQRIIAAAAWPWRALYAIFAYTGIRSGEALGLAWPHVDFKNRRLLIRQAASCGRLQSLKSKNSRADLQLPANLAAILESYRAVWSANAEQLLFPSPQGGPLWASGVRRNHLRPLLEELSIEPAGFHAFRHGHATNLFASGASAPTVRQMLRHGNIATTMRYTHTTDADLRAASDAIDAAIGGSQIQGEIPV
jgi:integrase